MPSKRAPDEMKDRGGFTLTVTLLALVLLAGLALAMVSLATIELKKSTLTEHDRLARENARIALILAIGQLQESLGPDTRISASSALVTPKGEQHWTGVWNTLAPDGKNPVIRNPETGSLTDLRQTQKYQRDEVVMRWLVSGQSPPGRLPADHTPLVGPGSVTDTLTGGVRVPLLEITTGGRSGKMAWWTGDLGQRANLTARTAPELIGIAPPIPGKIRDRLVSEATIALHTGNPQWAKDHFHDFTAHSSSLLIDNRQGGLKKDLSVYFQSTGIIDPAGDSPGLKDTDRLAGPANEQHAKESDLTWERNPFRKSAPRFGVLRHWAGLTATADEAMETVPP